MTGELSYSSDDLYGQYGYEGGQNVTFSALDAIISNLKVSSAQIESLAVSKLEAGGVIASDITFTGTLQGATGTFSGNLTSEIVTIDSNTERAEINFYNSWVESLGMRPYIDVWREQLTFGMRDGSQDKTFEYAAFFTNDFRIVGSNYKRPEYTDARLQVIGGSGMNAAIELQGVTPYIDFKNAIEDFDARIVLTSDNELYLDGANWKVSGSITSLGGGSFTGASWFNTIHADVLTGNSGNVDIQNATIWGQPVFRGIAGYTEAVYSAATRLRIRVTHNWGTGNHPMITPNWFSGCVSMDSVNNVYLENWDNNGFDIVVAGSGFAPGGKLGFSYYVMPI